MKSLEEMLLTEPLVNNEINDPITPDNKIEIPDYILNDPEVVGYPDTEMQEQIYKWVRSSLYLPGSLKDFGCGRGDFGNYLDFDFDYTGIDKIPVMVNSAKLKYPNLNIIKSDWFDYNDDTDYTTIIGSLNSNDGHDKWENFERTLLHAIDTTNLAVIFVLNRKTDLDGYVDYPIDELISRLPDNHPYNIDYSQFEDIYKLTIYCKSWN